MNYGNIFIYFFKPFESEERSVPEIRKWFNFKLSGGGGHAWKNKNEKHLQLEKVRTVDLTTLNQEQPTADSLTIRTAQFEIVKHSIADAHSTEHPHAEAQRNNLDNRVCKPLISMWNWSWVLITQMIHYQTDRCDKALQCKWIPNHTLDVHCSVVFHIF